MPRHTRLLLLILLAGAALRLLGLDNVSPPGLAHDEVANWLIVQRILAGGHAVYFTEAYGHEAGFHYLQAAYVALLGDHALALRLPAAHVGLLLVALGYALAARLSGRRTALLAAGWLALLFLPVFYSRLGLRAISMPLVSGFSAYAFWRGWQRPPQRALRGRLWSRGGAAGFWPGRAHTYLAARALPLFYGAFFLYLALCHLPFSASRLARHPALRPALLALTAAAAAALSWPRRPALKPASARCAARWTRCSRGDLRPVLANGLRIPGCPAGAAIRSGARMLPRRPVFDL